jgi:hypothetical protein
VGSAITGGVFYSGTSYPAQYQGAYFYGDYAQSIVRTLRVDASDALVAGSDATFASAADGPVDFEIGPDSNIYYLAINAGEVRRIRYTVGNTVPIAKAAGSPTAGTVPLAVQFSSAGTSDPDGDPLQYSWSFGDNTPVVTLSNPLHTYTSAGSYTAGLTVSDGRGGSASVTVPITAGNMAPTATITAPVSSLRYKVGDTITYAGSATDREDGVIPASGLSWTITLQHCPGGVCHTHPLQAGSGAGGTLVVEDHGDDTYYELTLTARDSGGLIGTATTKILPQTVQVTLATVTSPTSGAWSSIAIPPTSITAGSKYWIAVLGPAGGGTVQFRDTAAGAKSQTSGQASLSTLPATWSPGTG